MHAPFEQRARLAMGSDQFDSAERAGRQMPRADAVAAVDSSCGSEVCGVGTCPTLVTLLLADEDDVKDELERVTSASRWVVRCRRERIVSGA